MSTIVITGANRGIGLALCEQLKKQDYEIVALCRKSSPELDKLGVKVIDSVDVSSDSCVETIQKGLGHTQVDVLINNAGLLESTSLSNFDTEAMLRQFQVNTLGPLRVTKALLPNLKKGSRILNITSRMGSIADNTSGGSYGYRMSKAALNMATVSLAHDLKEKGIAVAMVHPGYVKTQMTGNSGDMLPPEAAEGILKRLSELTLETSGTFKHSKGQELPW